MKRLTYPEVEAGPDKLDANPQNVSSNLALKLPSVIEDDMYFVVPNGSLKLSVDFVTNLRVARDIVMEGKIQMPIARYQEIMTNSITPLSQQLASFNANMEHYKGSLSQNQDDIILSINDQINELIGIIGTRIGEYVTLKNIKERKTHIEQTIETLTGVMTMVITINTNVDSFIKDDNGTTPAVNTLLTQVDLLLLALVRTEIVKLPSSSFSYSLAKDVITDDELNALIFEVSKEESNVVSTKTASGTTTKASGKTASGIGGMKGGDDKSDALEAINSQFGARTVVDYLGNYHYKKIETQEEYDEYMKYFTYTIEMPINCSLSSLENNNQMINEFKGINSNMNSVAVGGLGYGGYNKTRRNRNKSKNKSRKVRKTIRQTKKSNKGTKKHKKIIKHKKTRSDN